jgi:hypothetical protein
VRTTVSWDPGNPLYYSKTKKQEVSKLEEKNVYKLLRKEERMLKVYWNFRPRERKNKENYGTGNL